MEFPARQHDVADSGVQLRTPTGPIAESCSGAPNYMTPTPPSESARDTSSPFAIIWMFAVIVLILLILANFSFGLLSSVRAYVGGESLWSKAQKDAVFHLQKYAASRDPGELRQFRANMAIPLGDH